MEKEQIVETSRTSNDSSDCDRYRPQKEYSRIQVVIDNLPYLFMILIGSAIQPIGFGFTPLGIGLAGIYLFYGIAGALWIILFVCPYCQYYDTRSCPCGYGEIAARLREKSSEDRFMEKFKRHIPFIVPLWIIPLGEGVFFLTGNFSRPMLIAMVAFMLNSYIILPLMARIYGCGHCPQKSNCPWMPKEGLRKEDCA